MSKSDAVERAMDRLGELPQAPAGDSVLYELRQFLRNRSNLVVAKAAAVSGHLNLRVLVPDLLVVFNKLIADASRLDRRCAALTEIVAALSSLSRSRYARCFRTAIPAPNPASDKTNSAMPATMSR